MKRLIRCITALLIFITPSVTHAAVEPAGDERCAKTVVLMGYWPPSNEMLRAWSNNPDQNPGTWIGDNWQNRGIDVLAFFPEFPPDGDPSNDTIGSAGSVGSADSDLQVDFQATTRDFWRIVDSYQPQLLITTSRGGSIGWEVEAVEGGHGSDADADPSRDWRTDDHGAVTLPTRDSIDPRSWAAISEYRFGRRLPSQLPMVAITSATSALDLTSVAIDRNGTSGNYLSGFLGLHGLYYQQLAAHNVAAGHIHVGRSVSSSDATQLMIATLSTVLDAHPADTLPCPVSAH